MVPVAIVRHGQPPEPPEELPALPEELPELPEAPLPAALLPDPPLAEPDEPAPVSVETGAGAVVVVTVVLGEVVSLVVDEVVGEVVFAVEPGVALVPELLYVLLRSVSLWQPGSAEVASATTAM
jgi:hypothetical protein